MVSSERSVEVVEQLLHVELAFTLMKVHRSSSAFGESQTRGLNLLAR